MSSVSNGFANGTAAGDTVIRGNSSGKIHLATSTSIRMSIASGGDTTFNGNVSISNDLTIPDKIIHTGDTNTAIRFPTTDNISFETGGSERLRVSNSLVTVQNSTLVASKITNSSSYTSHNANFYGGDVNSGGVRIELAHSTTTVSGNTASGAFPHHLLLSNYSGSGSADNRMVSIGFDIPTTVSHANATIAYQATGSGGQGDLQFWLESGNSSQERLRIQSNGSVGIGTDDASWGLSGAGGLVVGSGTGSQAITLYGTGNGDISFGDAKSGSARYSGLIRYNHTDDYMAFRTATQERFRIDSSGKVLIDHNASVGSGKLQVFTKTADALDILSFDDTAADGGRLTFYRNRNTTYGSNTKLAADDSLGRIDFRGMNTEGTDNYEIGASIRAEVDGTPGSGSDANDMPGRLMFFTTPDGSDTAQERLRITSTGDLSLRTTTQNAYLGLTANSTAINLTLGSTAGTNPRLYLKGVGNGQSDAGDVFIGSGTGGIVQIRSAELIKFEVNSDNTTAEALHITSEGKIGIANASPLYRLDIGNGASGNDPASGYQFRINAYGDYIFALAKQSNASFSI